MVAIVCLVFLAAEVAAADSIEPKHLTNLRQVTSGMEKAGEGYFSPDGKQIVYQAVPPGYPFYQIYSQPLSGQKPMLLSTGRGRTTCAYFHPTLDKILFSSSHLDPDLGATEEKERKELEELKKSGQHRRYNWVFDPHMEIFEADPDGANMRQLTKSKGYDAEGAYSPDGKLIAFCSDRDGDPDIYLMNADGTDVRQVTDSGGYDGGPFISPDGAWIIYRTDRKKKGFLQIHAIRTDGSQDTALTDNVGVNWAPYWHPTKPYIVWTGADHSNPKARPNYDLWLMKYEIKDGKISGSKPLRITDHAAADVLPVFSPDGKRLMWTSTRSDGHTSQLWIADFRFPE
jgi:Tol biopolymer transport system component